jgi:phosphohistidine phosphatase SixA
MPRWTHALLAAIGALALQGAEAADAAPSQPLEALRAPGRVLMLRHAHAPGNGDPPGYRIGDCATQRNLGDEGREQARRIGEQLRAAGIAQARLWSSQWCRCLETARLLALGPVRELPALNSFFDRPQDRDRQVAELRAFLAGLPLDGPPVVMVTHQVMVTAQTGGWVDSGGGALFARERGGGLRYLGPVDFK